VRSLGLMPESISHDWHVQPSCQRPNRGPPRRREFSPGENARKRFRLSSKLYNHTVRRKSRQSSLPTEFQMISTLGIFCRAGRESCRQEAVPHRACSPIRNDNAFWWRYSGAQQYESSDGSEAPASACIFCNGRFCDNPDGRQKIEKRTLLTWRSLL